MSNNKTRTKDKYRVVYNDVQRVELENEFRVNEYIAIPRKQEIAQKLQLSERQIKIWFQNRRAKKRKQQKRQQTHHLTTNSNSNSNNTCNLTATAYHQTSPVERVTQHAPITTIAQANLQAQQAIAPALPKLESGLIIEESVGPVATIEAIAVTPTEQLAGAYQQQQLPQPQAQPQPQPQPPHQLLQQHNQNNHHHHNQQHHHQQQQQQQPQQYHHQQYEHYHHHHHHHLSHQPHNHSHQHHQYNNLSSVIQQSNYHNHHDNQLMIEQHYANPMASVTGQQHSRANSSPVEHQNFISSIDTGSYYYNNAVEAAGTNVIYRGGSLKHALYN